MTTKSVINEMLKAKFKLDKLRIDADIAVYPAKGKPLRNSLGGYIPGIFCWGHSPMDVTNIGTTNAFNKYTQIKDAVLALPGAVLMDMDAGFCKIQFNAGQGKKQFNIFLNLTRAPKYSPGRRMDSGYQNSYVTVRYDA